MRLFLKLGGSLITDKTAVEAIRRDVLQRLAAEIYQAKTLQPALELLIGHGGGSFGHVAAARYQTRQGVRTAAQWRGFAEVSAAMNRLNTELINTFLQAGVPAIRLQPSASAMCRDGQLVQLDTTAVLTALQAGLVPVVHGDVAFDEVRGGTIISTEEVMDFLVARIRPFWLLLAGETEGVLDDEGRVIPHIHPDNFAQIAPLLGGSRGTDVTGGMAAKVQAMVALAGRLPGLQVRIFSGLESGVVAQVLTNPETAVGTLITGSL
ncbi:MAG: uridylate kinase [Chloroflexi bacterium]|nr:MAG: uridylate kinase [Chloroflexota bacterium]